MNNILVTSTVGNDPYAFSSLIEKFGYRGNYPLVVGGGYFDLRQVADATAETAVNNIMGLIDYLDNVPNKVLLRNVMDDNFIAYLKDPEAKVIVSHRAMRAHIIKQGLKERVLEFYDKTVSHYVHIHDFYATKTLITPYGFNPKLPAMITDPEDFTTCPYLLEEIKAKLVDGRDDQVTSFDGFDNIIVTAYPVQNFGYYIPVRIGNVWYIDTAQGKVFPSREQTVSFKGTLSLYGPNTVTMLNSRDPSRVRYLDHLYPSGWFVKDKCVQHWGNAAQNMSIVHRPTPEQINMFGKSKTEPPVKKQLAAFVE